MDSREVVKDLLSSGPDRHGKFVRFNDNKAVINPIPVTLSSEEFQSCFYTDDDLERMNYDVSNTYKIIMDPSKKNGDDDEHTSRGLEHHYNRNLQTIQGLERAALVQAIKREQIRQKASGSYPDMVRFQKISADASKSARDRARNLGIRDEQESRRIEKMNPTQLLRSNQEDSPFSFLVEKVKRLLNI